MSNSLNLIESVAHDRHSERYRRQQRGKHTSPEARAIETTRRRAGWLLVGLGLRLVTGGDKAAAQRARLIGQ